MSESKPSTHRHIDGPSEAQLKELVAGKGRAVSELYLDAHRLVMQTLPKLEQSVDCTDAMIRYGMRQYGYNGWGMAALAPYTKWVSLAFFRGAHLEDPDGLLEGTGASVRHVKIRTAEQLAERRTALVRMLQAAATTNDG